MGHTKPKVKVVIILFILCCVVSCSKKEKHGSNEYFNHYINDPETSTELKEAIKKGKVIEGMCPFQAFAAAGLPGLYKVEKDQDVWQGTVPPPEIINAQCSYPDNSVFELEFRNTTQFDSNEPILFRVKFEKGVAVLIDKKRIGE